MFCIFINYVKFTFVGQLMQHARFSLSQKNPKEIILLFDKLTKSLFKLTK